MCLLSTYKFLCNSNPGEASLDKGMHGMNFFQPLRIADSCLLLMADINKMTVNFTFLYFKRNP